MDTIKNDFWSSFLLKHKEFQDSLNIINSSLDICVIGPISELVSNSSDFLLNYYQQVSHSSVDSKSFLKSIERIHKYPITISYNQSDLRKFDDIEESLRFIRGRIIEVNCVAVNKYCGISEEELSVEPGDKLEVRDGNYHEHWCKGIKEDGTLGFLPSNCIRIHKYANILTDLSDGYAIKEINLRELLEIVGGFCIKTKGFINKLKEFTNISEISKKIFHLGCKLQDLLKINDIFLEELKSRIKQALIGYIPYLSLYLDIYNIIPEILTLSTENIRKSPTFNEILSEIVRDI